MLLSPSVMEQHWRDQIAKTMLMYLIMSKLVIKDPHFDRNHCMDPKCRSVTLDQSMTGKKRGNNVAAGLGVNYQVLLVLPSLFKLTMVWRSVELSCRISFVLPVTQSPKTSELLLWQDLGQIAEIERTSGLASWDVLTCSDLTTGCWDREYCLDVP